MAYYGPPAILRIGSILAATTVILSAGVYFIVRAPNNSDPIIYKCQTASGAQTCKFTGSGSSTWSGSVISQSNVYALETVSGTTLQGKTITGNTLTIGGGKGSIDSDGEFSGSGVILSGDSAAFSGKTISLTSSGGIIVPGANGGCYRLRFDANYATLISLESITCPTPGVY